VLTTIGKTSGGGIVGSATHCHPHQNTDYRVTHT
jgi:hypothetical protein